jgi:hypothetical protein
MVYRCARYRMEAASSPSGPPNCKTQQKSHKLVSNIIKI